MKSKLVIASLLLAGATTVSAQNKDKYYSESWKDNIFVSVGAGVQGTTNPDTDFGKSVTPLINVSLGKFINPIWGFRGQVYGWQSKQETAYPFGSVAGSQAVERKENYFGVNLDGMVNLTNLFMGYQPGRLFELNFFVGPSMNVVKNYKGWNMAYKNVPTKNPDGSITYTNVLDPSKVTPANHELRCLVGASLGLGAKFNLNDKWAIDVEARGQVTPSILGAYSSGSTDGYIHLTAGATYTFGGKKFVKAQQIDENAINAEINKYRSELAQAQADLANAKNALANAKPDVKEVTKEIEVAGPRAIFFKIGRANIDDYGLVNIELAAKILKANPSKKYKVAGYADKATGSASWNQKLSEKRAQNVYDALIKQGVDKDQLELIGFGGTANMFGKNFLNRVVILE